ncbi:hypothetical protein [Sphingosinicella rhizophila]|uniref:Uncharacterized protein n=1 Tax=Sphingosinicella rhizophila TaxID=3050082 RepID=A0ABU3QBA1_9SPHN|nr:hypothetical protein [Sphingosinicella sp. GR2756]MDT9600572.1 hypothetical protein [Sphingosinicella sp. GR2756]
MPYRDPAHSEATVRTMESRGGLLLLTRLILWSMRNARKAG